MTAIMPEQSPTAAALYGLVTPRAVRVAAIADPVTRRQVAAQALADRRSDVALLRTLLIETYGLNVPSLAHLEDADEVLTELSVLVVA